MLDAGEESINIRKMVDIAQESINHSKGGTMIKNEEKNPWLRELKNVGYIPDIHKDDFKLYYHSDGVLVGTIGCGKTGAREEHVVFWKDFREPSPVPKREMVGQLNIESVVK